MPFYSNSTSARSCTAWADQPEGLVREAAGDDVEPLREGVELPDGG
jgi:hypothetical protein